MIWRWCRYLSEDTVRILERVEVKLDEMRRAMEQMPPRSKSKLVTDFAFAREIRRLKGELKALVDALLEGTPKLPATESKRISAIGLANLSIRAASAICDAPVLNFLKPVVGIAEIISETAQTAKSNRSAALQLASHSGMVTKSIVEHAGKLGLDGMTADSEALVALKSVLENIHLYLTDLQKPHRARCFKSWIMANEERDRIAEFNQGLDKALALLTSANVSTTHTEVREIVTLVRRNGDVVRVSILSRVPSEMMLC
ncbi:hypothetical protein C8R45DRAFT_328620 [Mycena sanguinolenta]|nr:hypothetical protein C8R45DRAFT_328620 [Mycena sanguinolenta]